MLKSAIVIVLAEETEGNIEDNVEQVVLPLTDRTLTKKSREDEANDDGNAPENPDASHWIEPFYLAFVVFCCSV